MVASPLLSGCGVRIGFVPLAECCFPSSVGTVFPIGGGWGYWKSIAVLLEIYWQQFCCLLLSNCTEQRTTYVPILANRFKRLGEMHSPKMASLWIADFMFKGMANVALKKRGVATSWCLQNMAWMLDLLVFIKILQVITFGILVAIAITVPDCKYHAKLNLVQLLLLAWIVPVTK